jgi:glycosyltransferase involved in cell wall biosynthesis
MELINKQSNNKFEIITDSIKIAFIHNRYINYRIPLFELLHKNFDITFFFEYEGQKQETKIHSSFSVTFYLPRRPRYRLSPALFLKLLVGKYDIFVAGDINQPNTYLACCIARLKRKSFIVWSEEWHPKEALHLKRLQMKRAIVRYSDACIAPGKKSADFLKYLGAEDKKIFVAPNASIPCVHNNQTQLSTIPDSIFPSNAIKILFLGRIIPSKGIDYLIKAFAEIERKGLNALLLIAGDGPYLTNLENLVSKENIKNVLFTKRYATNVAKTTLYKDCDIFVLPSVYYSYVEGWGLVLNEVMYFGKPVIATEMVGSAYDLIENGTNGYIVPEKNVEALSQALAKIINDGQLRKSMGQMSKRIIEEGYKVSDMVNGFGDAIDFVCSDFKTNK